MRTRRRFKFLAAQLLDDEVPFGTGTAPCSAAPRLDEGQEGHFDADADTAPCLAAPPLEEEPGQLETDTVPYCRVAQRVACRSRPGF